MAIPHLSEGIEIRSVGRSQAPKGVSFTRPWGKPRSVHFYQLWSITSGIGKITHNGVSSKVSPGNLYLFRVGDTYEVTQDPENPLLVTFLILSIHPNAIKQFAELPDLIDEYTHDVVATVHSLILDLYWEAYQDSHQEEINEKNLAGNRGGNAHLITPNPTIIHATDIKETHSAIVNANAYFSVFIAEVFRCFHRSKGSTLNGIDGRHRRVIDGATRRIQHEPGSIKNVAQIAEECGYSLDHFSRTFKSITGLSPQQCLIDSRINTAQHWLDDSDLSVKEIAADLGYSNAQFFARQFKQMVGMAPSAYRKRKKSPTPKA